MQLVCNELPEQGEPGLDIRQGVTDESTIRAAIEPRNRLVSLSMWSWE